MFSERNCISLPSPLLTTPNQLPVVEGTVVEVECEQGYKLQGSGNMTCTAEGEFMALRETACFSKSYWRFMVFLEASLNRFVSWA